jgi:hypothetical protein
MRTRLLLFGVAIVLLALILFGGLTIVQTLRSQDPFYGTFTNEQMSPQKAVCFPGGFKDYALASDTVPVDEGTERIVAHWTDSVGTHWYKTQATRPDGKYLTLQKVSKSGTVRELTANQVADFASGDFPTTIDPAGAIYLIWYRTAK